MAAQKPLYIGARYEPPRARIPHRNQIGDRPAPHGHPQRDAPLDLAQNRPDAVAELTLRNLAGWLSHVVAI